MTRRALRDDEQAIAAVVGAIIILAVLGIALVYVNAFHVPRQGAAMEVMASERAEGALASLAGALGRPAQGPLVQDVPLRVDRATPPLLSGIVLSPARAEGSLALLPASSTIRVSVVVPAPAEGVPAGDATRESVAGGLMRVHLVGTSAAGQPMGALRATTGGTYVSPSGRVLEGGAVLADTLAASATVAPPALTVNGDAVAWRLPLLAGAPGEVSGGSLAQVVLTPGPEAELGGGSAVNELRVRVETTHLAAWKAAFESTVGTRGSVTATSTGPDDGIVEARLDNVQLRLFVVRYQVSLADRV
ncbi:MAG TPA: hypothetical protein VM582_05705 [Candidatus Thermoplasmatota archaeon]|nr:hypothetical protein [Candidatus Thermoplasmatota archaeon]